MNLKITFKKYEKLVQRGFTLDMIFLLKLIQEDFDVCLLCSETPKLSLLCQTILRKQLITENYKLTIEGKELLAFFDTPTRETIVRVRPADDLFEAWWKLYPGTDTFTHAGVSFTGSRGLRVYKEECKIKFDKILGEGEHTANDLIEALNFDVLQKKENSVKLKTNKMTYMQNSLTYLNQRTFEPFIELIKEGVKIEQQSSAPLGGVDI